MVIFIARTNRKSFDERKIGQKNAVLCVYVFARSKRNWSMYGSGERVCVAFTKKGRKTWKWNNRNQNGFKYNTWRHKHICTHTTHSHIEIYLFYWPLFSIIFFFPPFRNSRSQQERSVFKITRFFLLFVWIVTFYKSWQDNILPLLNKPNNRKKNHPIVTVESMHHEKSHRPETSCEWKEKCKKKIGLSVVYLGSRILFFSQQLII